MTKCVICDRRPARTDKGYCLQCDASMHTHKAKQRPVKPERFITYRGHVIGLFRNGGTSILVARLLKRDPVKLPKRKTLDLNTYLTGFDRAQIKKMKRTVLALAGA